MRSLVLGFFALYLLAGSIVSSSDESEAVGVSNGDTIQYNPEYLSEYDNYDEENDDSDDSDEIDDEIYDDDTTDDELVDETKEDKKSRRNTKSAISKALTGPSRLKKFIGKHKGKIIAVAFIYAFRRELQKIAYNLVTVNVVDKKTGEQKRVLSVNPTSVVRIILFVSFIWRIRNSQADGGDLMDDEASLLPTSSAALLSSVFKSSVYVPRIEQHWTFERINERYDKDMLAFQKAMGEMVPLSLTNDTAVNDTSTKLSLGTFLQDIVKSPSSSHLSKRKYNGTALVMDLTDLTTSLNNIDLIRDQVSLILFQHASNQTLHDTEEAELEVVVLLESPGGSASDYGLAAQQLLRLANAPGIKLTICVDKVAASGGYMMASTAHQIIAAPFAIIGSIGVYGQVLNIHNLLNNNGIQDLILRAGENKAPLGMIGEVNEAGIATMQTMLEETHEAFRNHVATTRPILKDTILEVATGDIWLGQAALEKKLVDRLLTSDEYLQELMNDGRRLLKIVQNRRGGGGRGLFGLHTRGPPTDFTGIASKVKNRLGAWLVGENYKTILEQSLKARSATIQTKSAIS